MVLLAKQTFSSALLFTCRWADYINSLLLHFQLFQRRRSGPTSVNLVISSKTPLPLKASPKSIPYLPSSPSRRLPLSPQHFLSNYHLIEHNLSILRRRVAHFPFTPHHTIYTPHATNLYHGTSLLRSQRLQMAGLYPQSHRRPASNAILLRGASDCPGCMQWIDRIGILYRLRDGQGV